MHFHTQWGVLFIRSEANEPARCLSSSRLNEGPPRGFAPIAKKSRAWYLLNSGDLFMDSWGSVMDGSFQVISLKELCHDSILHHTEEKILRPKFKTNVSPASRAPGTRNLLERS